MPTNSTPTPGSDRKSDEPCGDPIVEANVQFLRSRSSVGQEKYGTKLTRTDLTIGQWIDHTLEELGDAMNYLRRLKSAMPSPLLDMTGGNSMKAESGNSANSVPKQ